MSEGKEERINKILDYYHLRGYFKHTYMFRKDSVLFRQIILELVNTFSITTDEIIVVGDLLDRDIYHGNLVSATTIHKPGGYKPNQEPQNEYEIPNYVISKISDLISII